MSSDSLHVTICGGGIGGLMLVLVIGKYGTHPVDVFEAGPTITTIGAGISFYARTLDIMKELGLYDDIVNMAIKPPEESKVETEIWFRKSDQTDGFHWFTRKLNRGFVSIHRKDLVDLLVRRIPDSCKIHTSKKLKSYAINSSTRKIVLSFCDGSTAITDVLVGADGIHSATRRTMYQDLGSSARDDTSRERLLRCIDPVWTGILVYRYLLPTEKLLREYPDVKPPDELTMYLGKNKHIVAFPISQGRLINVVIFTHNSGAFGTPFEGRWVMDVPDKTILDLLENWELQASAMAKCVEKPSRWALHSVRALPHYVCGRVALLGDAAHAMEPHFGAGAGQAIEDAFVLGRLLTLDFTNRANVSDALKVYEEARLPFANDVVQRSQNIGRYYGFQQVPADGPIPSHNGPEELNYMRRSIENAWEWQSVSKLAWKEVEERWRAKCRSYVKL